MDTANLLLGLFLPFIISLIKQSGFDDRLNRLIAVLVYAGWAFIATAFLGFHDGYVVFLKNFVETMIAGTITYQLILKGFGIDDAITHATSVVKPPVEEVVVEEAG